MLSKKISIFILSTALLFPSFTKADSDVVRLISTGILSAALGAGIAVYVYAGKARQSPTMPDSLMNHFEYLFQKGGAATAQGEFVQARKHYLAFLSAYRHSEHAALKEAFREKGARARIEVERLTALGRNSEKRKLLTLLEEAQAMMGKSAYQKAGGLYRQFIAGYDQLVEADLSKDLLEEYALAKSKSKECEKRWRAQHREKFSALDQLQKNILKIGLKIEEIEKTETTFDIEGVVKAKEKDYLQILGKALPSKDQSVEIYGTLREPSHILLYNPKPGLLAAGSEITSSGHCLTGKEYKKHSKWENVPFWIYGDCAEAHGLPALYQQKQAIKVKITQLKKALVFHTSAKQ